MYLTKLFTSILTLSILLISCGENVKENKISTETPISQKSFGDLLTAPDIEKVSGLSGVKLVPKDPSKGAGGNLNFATSDDKLIVMVQFVDKSQYAGFKQYFYKGDIKGLGDEAMKGATLPNNPENNVTFTKGNTCVALTVFVNMNDMNKNMLTIEQTIELAKIIAGRM